MTPVVDIATLRSLPKISLHDHLDGGVRLTTLLELADQAGVPSPAPDEAKLATWFSAKANSGSLVDYLETFQLSGAVLQSEHALERVAAEFVEDLAADGVVYGEVRWAPDQHLQGGMTLQQAVDAVQAGLNRGEAEARLRGHSIQAHQILCAMRNLDQSMEIAQLALTNRDRGVVGFDIAGPEAGFPPSRHRAASDLLAENLFPVTVHAGEAAGVESIRSALIDGRAIRIGHGVRLAQDISRDGAKLLLGETAAWVRDRHIGLEVSPSSNVQTGATQPWAKAWQLTHSRCSMNWAFSSLSTSTIVLSATQA